MGTVDLLSVKNKPELGTSNQDIPTIPPILPSRIHRTVHMGEQGSYFSYETSHFMP